MKVQNVLILVMALAVLFMSSASAETFYCVNCSDCNEKIANASIGDVVVLTADIVDFDGDCINFGGKDGIVFDGGGYIIDGVNTANKGICLSSNSDNNTVHNVSVTDFRYGVYLEGADYNTVHNVTAYENDEGITVAYCVSNLIEDCDLYENIFEDFHLITNAQSYCIHNVSNVTGSGGRPIGYYVGEHHLKDMEFSFLYLADADNSTVDNVTVDGSSVYTNNGLRLFHSDNVTLTNIVSVGNYNGIYLSRSHGNRVFDANCSITYASGTDSCGIYSTYSDNNIFKNVTVGHGYTGVWLSNSDDNVLDSINATNCLAYGIQIGGTDNVLNNSYIKDTSWVAGLNMMSSSGNLIYNNWFNNSCGNAKANSANDWNVSNRTGPNIIGGPSIGGNYWSDYDYGDMNGDGFGSSPYVVDWDIDNTDYLPLVEVSGGEEMYIRNFGHDLQVGDVFEYLVTCRNASGHDIDCLNLSWNSSNTTVGTMSDANLTCLAVGVTNITVTGDLGNDTILQNVTAAPSGINNVSMVFDDYYVAECGSSVVQVRMNSSNDVDKWMATIGFDSNKVNITDVDFTDSVSSSFGGWSHNGSYVVMGGDIDYVNPIVGEYLLANFTVDCNCSGGCVGYLNFIGEDDVDLFLSVDENNATGHKVQVFHNVTWEGGSIQCVGCGDVNCNGAVTITDVVQTYYRVANPGHYLVSEWAADVNDSGSITITDVVEIYYRVANPGHLLNCAC